MAVRPAVTWAKFEREDPSILDLQSPQDVGFQLELRIVPDEPRIAVNTEQLGILDRTDQ